MCVEQDAHSASLELIEHRVRQRRIEVVRSELHLGDDVLVPDLAGWRRERMPVVPDTAYFTSAPDWICEVLSPHTARLDRHKKLAIYAREGVSHAWLLDPIERTLEVPRLEGRQWMIVAVHASDEEVRAEPFEAISLALARLWVD